MDDPELEQSILAFVRRPNYKPVKPRVIAERLRLPRSEAAAVKKAVKRLVAQGELAYGSSHLVLSSSPREPNRDRVVGVYRRTDAGFGFVRPAKTAGTDPVQDIYVAAEDSADAASGDVVAVRLKKHRHRGRMGVRGEVLEILERETHRFVGTYLESRDAAFVQVDGAVFQQPVFVGDPGAHRVEENDKVVVEIVRFPSHLHRGEGVIVEVLGPKGQPGVDTLSILREFDLPEQFPEEVVEEAREQAERFDESIGANRFDATGETVITIDPVDARDFDDAISLVVLEGGNWRLGVHIADVSHFVRPKTALDREAYERATSVYLPDRVLPMLPEQISNSLASLQPGKVRYTKTAYLEFTTEGIRTSIELRNTAIRSAQRLTYEQVDAFLADPAAFRSKWGPAVCELLERMRALAATLRRRRRERGALELAMPEVRIDLDKQGRVVGAHVEENTESHQIIEEFMLSANEAVAETLFGENLLFLRRIHRAPSELKLRALQEFIEALGLPAEDVRSRFGLQKLLADVVGRPEQHAVNYAVLRSMQRAVYSAEEEGHYALSSDCYCHFTSPIRRYPDLTVHRLVDSVLWNRKPRQDAGELLVVGEHCSEREDRAEQSERQLKKLKLLHYLSERIGEEMDGVITGVESFGLFVQGVQLPAEGLIHVDSLVDDYYRYDRAAHTLSGHRSGNTFRLGDLVRVAVARVDLERRQLDFRLLGRERRPPQAVKPPAERSKGGPKRGTKTPPRESRKGAKGRKGSGRGRRG